MLIRPGEIFHGYGFHFRYDTLLPVLGVLSAQLNPRSIGVRRVTHSAGAGGGTNYWADFQNSNAIR